MDASCPRCGGDTDSVYHRLWRCAATAGARAEIPRAAGEDSAEEKLRALIAAGGTVKNGRGWRPRGGLSQIWLDTLPSPPEEVTEGVASATQRRA